jgi:hypothetical protein
LGCDPSALVRRTVLKNIGLSKLVLSLVVKRTIDVDESVRVAAFRYLVEKVGL